jgi:hypothetical protein
VLGDVGGGLFTWGGDFTWQQRGKRDHHEGCLGLGDLAGRLVPTMVKGEDDIKQVRLFVFCSMYASHLHPAEQARSMSSCTGWLLACVLACLPALELPVENSAVAPACLHVASVDNWLATCLSTVCWPAWLQGVCGLTFTVVLLPQEPLLPNK